MGVPQVVSSWRRRCWRDDADLLRASSVDLLLFSMTSNLQKSRNYTEDEEGLRQNGLFFDPQPWPVYIAWESEKVDFAGGVKLKSETEMDQHSGNSGDG